MKILLYGINFAPALTGIGKFTGVKVSAWIKYTFSGNIAHA